MPQPADLLAALLIGMGLLFFVAGTVGVLRFPDACTRLHAVTKADNLGLGLLLSGAGLLDGRLTTALQFALIWFLVIFSGATTAHLIARASLQHPEEES